jgi:hypothetical protein
MSVQLPIPSFEDIRKMLQFWIDQQDKWYYFEGISSESGTTGEAQVPNPLHSRTTVDRSTEKRTVHYLQTRLVGKIGDVVSYPPSLLLLDTRVFSALVSYDYGLRTSIVSQEVRPKYGLVFSQITYYEPIEELSQFLAEDPRISTTR